MSLKSGHILFDTFEHCTGYPRILHSILTRSCFSSFFQISYAGFHGNQVLDSIASPSNMHILSFCTLSSFIWYMICSIKDIYLWLNIFKKMGGHFQGGTFGLVGRIQNKLCSSPLKVCLDHTFLPAMAIMLIIPVDYIPPTFKTTL